MTGAHATAIVDGGNFAPPYVPKVQGIAGALRGARFPPWTVEMGPTRPYTVDGTLLHAFLKLWASLSRAVCFLNLLPATPTFCPVCHC